MLHVEGEGTDSPTADYVSGKATVTCDGCATTKAGFPLALVTKLNGSALVVSSVMFKCSCDPSTTVYSVSGPEPIIPVLLKLLGF